MVKEVAPHKRYDDTTEYYAMANAFATAHRSLQVLQKQCTSFYANFMSVLQTIAIFTVVLNTYQAVVGGSMRSLVLALALVYGFA